MAQLRAIGCFIELSGIPELWIESGMYGDEVTKRILDGKLVRRSIEAHVVTLQVLFPLMMEEFFKDNSDARDLCAELVDEIMDSWNLTVVLLQTPMIVL